MRAVVDTTGMEREGRATRRKPSSRAGGSFECTGRPGNSAETADDPRASLPWIFLPRAFSLSLSSFNIPVFFLPRALLPTIPLSCVSAGCVITSIVASGVLSSFICGAVVTVLVILSFGESQKHVAVIILCTCIASRGARQSQSFL